MKVLAFVSSEEYYIDLKLRMRILKEDIDLQYIKKIHFEPVINEMKIELTSEFDDKHGYVQDKIIRVLSGKNHPLQYKHVTVEIHETDTYLKPAKR